MIAHARQYGHWPVVRGFLWFSDILLSCYKTWFWLWPRLLYFLYELRILVCHMVVWRLSFDWSPVTWPKCYKHEPSDVTHLPIDWSLFWLVDLWPIEALAGYLHKLFCPGPSEVLMGEIKVAFVMWWSQSICQSPPATQHPTSPDFWFPGQLAIGGDGRLHYEYIEHTINLQLWKGDAKHHILSGPSFICLRSSAETVTAPCSMGTHRGWGGVCMWPIRRDGPYRSAPHPTHQPCWW